jgi:hypothetical protein
MTAKDYLDIIANEIHRTIVATVDDSGMSCRCGGKKGARRPVDVGFARTGTECRKLWELRK